MSIERELLRSVPHSEILEVCHTEKHRRLCRHARHRNTAQEIGLTVFTGHR